MIAARLHLIADQIVSGTPEEESIKRELLDNIKKEFVKVVKEHPAYRDKDPEEIWKRIEPAIKVEVRKVLSADAA
jgi:hypothetical protein